MKDNNRKNKLIYLLIPLVVIIGVVIGIRMCSENNLKKKLEEESITEVIDSTELEQKHYKYGIPSENFEVVEDVVGKNQNLSAILQRYRVSPAKIHEAVLSCKEIFDVRKIRTGHKYTLFLANDSLKTPEFFIYEKNNLEYVVIDFKEQCNAYEGRKDVEMMELTAKIGISSSLWNAMKDAGTNPNLAITLADIYAWSIDFYGIAKNDSIRVIYDQPFVEGEPLTDFTVKGAVFRHMGKDYYAIPYLQEERIAFFDENGNSLQKAFLKAPLKYSRISSGFSNSRYHPVLKINRAHHGVDYAAPTGTPVYTIGDGTVTKKAFQKNGGGNYITIKHNSVYSTTYMHLSKFAKGINVGSRIKQGDVIGYVGSTGLSTGPHLDFRVYKNGQPINPLKMESPSKEPISAENMDEFLVLRDSLVSRLNTL
ncbi:MAG: peptidoglycan DD-metalloendopeptidase family protein [Bacteroidales bacterium]|nr:peptidoglycan DD-metalloendopeptidase family protein [Bacteroidales bacterium]